MRSTVRKLETGATKLEERLTKVGTQLGHIEERISAIERRLDVMEGSLQEIRTGVERNFRWLAGTVIAVLVPMWGSTLLAILLAK
jgi:hypothetical protein